MTDSITRQIDYTKKDYAALREELLSLARERLPEWTDHSPNDPGVVLVELFSYLGDIILYYQDRIANESYLNTAMERRSIIDLLRLIGYELRPPQPASADINLLFENVAVDSDQDIEIVIPQGAEFTTTKANAGQVVRFRYLLDDLIITIKDLEPKSYGAKGVFLWYKNKLPVVQVDGYREMVTLGSSNGGRKQRFCLPDKPLIDGQLEVYVDKELWRCKKSLLESLTDSKHYTVFRDESDDAWVEFGDDRYGKIPFRNTNIQATYPFGGGVKGNVSAHTITKVVTGIDYLKHAFNPQAATAGSEAESSQEAIAKGPRLFRAQNRAVTLQDYEDYAKQFGIAKARARAGAWNVVELYVAPVGGGYPTDTLKADLRAFFEDKRIVTYRITVKDPVYVPVYIEGDLDVEPYFFSHDIRQKVENAVSRLLAFDSVKFEDKLYLSKVYEAIEKVEGVAGINITWFDRYPKPTETENAQFSYKNIGKLTFQWNEIPTVAFASGIQLNNVSGGSRA